MAEIDAVYLTEKGQIETRYTRPSLYGWDCECVLIINPHCVTPIGRSSTVVSTICTAYQSVEDVLEEQVFLDQRDQDYHRLNPPDEGVYP